MRENRVNSEGKDLHCPKPLISFVTENGSGSGRDELFERRYEEKGAPEIGWDVCTRAASAGAGL